MLRKPVPSSHQLAGQSVAALAPEQYVFCYVCHSCLTLCRNVHFIVRVSTSILDDRTPAPSDCHTRSHIVTVTQLHGCHLILNQEMYTYLTKAGYIAKRMSVETIYVRSCMHRPFINSPYQAYQGGHNLHANVPRLARQSHPWCDTIKTWARGSCAPPCL